MSSQSNVLTYIFVNKSFKVETAGEKLPVDHISTIHISKRVFWCKNLSFLNDQITPNNSWFSFELEILFLKQKFASNISSQASKNQTLH